MKTLLASATTNHIRHIQGTVNNYFYSTNWVVDENTLLLSNNLLPVDVVKRKNEQFKIIKSKNRYKFYQV